MATKIEHIGKHYRLEAESLPDIFRYLDTTPKQWRSTSSVKNPATREWDLRAGYSGALQYAQTGWSEGGKDLTVKVASMPRSNGSVMRWQNGPTGTRVDLGRYLVGDPNCMMRRVRHGQQRAPIIRLAVSICANASESAQAMANYGAAICAAVESLEAGGATVEVSAHFVTSVSGHRVAVGWMVKRSGEFLDMAALAFSCAHPAALRRLGFALIERTPARIEDSSYGAAQRLQLSDLFDAPRNTICLNGMASANRNAETLGKAVAHVEAEIGAALKDWQERD